MTRGIVMEIGKRHAVVLTPDGRFCKVPAGQAGIVGEEISFAEPSQSRRPRILYSAGIGAAAVMLLIFVPLLTLFNGAQPAVAAYLTLDINPSVEIGVNDQEKVEEIRALNKGGEAIIAGLPYKNQSVGVVAGAIMERAGSGAYGGTDDIVITSVVLSETLPGEYETLLTRHVDEAVQEALARSNQETSDKVMVTTLSAPKELRDEANENGISTGKMAVYLMAKSEGHDVTIEEMKKQSIHQAAEAWGGLDAIVKTNGAKKDNQQKDDQKTDKPADQKANNPETQQPGKPDKEDHSKDNGKDNGKGSGKDNIKDQDESQKKQLQKLLEDQKKRLKDLLDWEKHDSAGVFTAQSKQSQQETAGHKNDNNGHASHTGHNLPDMSKGDTDNSKDKTAEREKSPQPRVENKGSNYSGDKEDGRDKGQGQDSNSRNKEKNREDSNGPGKKNVEDRQSDASGKNETGQGIEETIGKNGVVQAGISWLFTNPFSGRGSEKKASDGRIIGVKDDAAALENGAKQQSGWGTGATGRTEGSDGQDARLENGRDKKSEDHSAHDSGEEVVKDDDSRTKSDRKNERQEDETRRNDEDSNRGGGEKFKPGDKDKEKVGDKSKDRDEAGDKSGDKDDVKDKRGSDGGETQ